MNKTTIKVFRKDLVYKTSNEETPRRVITAVRLPLVIEETLFHGVYQFSFPPGRM